MCCDCHVSVRVGVRVRAYVCAQRVCMLFLAYLCNYSMLFSRILTISFRGTPHRVSVVAAVRALVRESADAARSSRSMARVHLVDTAQRTHVLHVRNELLPAALLEGDVLVARDLLWHGAARELLADDWSAVYRAVADASLPAVSSPLSARVPHALCGMLREACARPLPVYGADAPPTHAVVQIRCTVVEVQFVCFSHLT